MDRGLSVDLGGIFFFFCFYFLGGGGEIIPRCLRLVMLSVMYKYQLPRSK